VIAYAACIGDPEKFQNICLPGLKRVAGPDDLLIEAEHPHSIFAAYNEVLDAVRDRDDLEALVLLHEDTEVADPQFGDLIRRHVAEPDVAVVGTVGARRVRGLAWWEADTRGRVLETRGVIDFGGGTHDVETVDGLVMGLSPWAVRNLRFDEDGYEGFDAYDADFCAQARAAGKRVIVTELPVVHRHSRVGNVRATSDGGSFDRNDAIFRAKWLSGMTVASAKRTRMRDKSDGYFGLTRPEIRALVPATAQRVLDVGCGAGGLGAALKEDRGCEVFGLEGFPDAAKTASERLDGVICIDLDTLDALPPEWGKFDAIVFGDVLEHLRDPARLIGKLLPALADDGAIVGSIPNVKHWSVLLPLLAQDRWAYEDAGLLDRTHVHFFTAHEMTAMFAQIGLELVRLEVNDHAPLPPQLQPLADVAEALGTEGAEAAARLGAYQYLVVARRSDSESPVADDALPAMPSMTHEELLALVPESAQRVLEVGPDTELGSEPYDALIVRGALEGTTDPRAMLRKLIPSLTDDGVIVAVFPNVKHWSVLRPLLVEDRWENRDLRYFTLEEISNLLDELGLEGVELVTNDSAPLPAELSPLVELAVAAGAEREETALRLGAYEYAVVVKRAA
jgi:SAM-dependent methyltransferase